MWKIAILFVVVAMIGLGVLMRSGSRDPEYDGALGAGGGSASAPTAASSPASR